MQDAIALVHILQHRKNKLLDECVNRFRCKIYVFTFLTSQMSTILKIINVERDIKLKLVVVHFCQNK